ncbi:MAG: toll/interleukin-1 receptor domain-containing protein [Ilumatobacteraceae bacterium]
MKVFLSYRRDDTAGRAGRIADVFTTRYGARNVFQDVSAAAPGLDFTERVDAAIGNSDVMLVVIGRGWLSSTGDDGGRRIDRPDDFVRREVAAALAADIRVVPVLVDGAELPTAGQLPDELSGMLRRQAVSVRDVSWHQDVDDLIRRLEGDEREPLEPRRRRWLLVAGVAVVVIAAAAIASLLASRDDEGGDTSSGELPPCPVPDSAWARAETVGAAPVEVTVDDLVSVEVAIADVWSGLDGEDPMVLVAVDVRNVSEPVEGTADETYVGAGDIGGLLVDGIALPSIACLSATGDQQAEPTERVILTVGFDTAADPSTSTLTLEAYGDTDFPVTSAG